MEEREREAELSTLDRNNRSARRQIKWTLWAWRTALLSRVLHYNTHHYHYYHPTQYQQSP
jgi:hypothetical protein